MSSIKPKKGICVDCDPNSGEKYLTAGRCGFHYPIHRKKISVAKLAGGKKIKADKLNIFFASQLLEAPDLCENECGKSIVYFKNIRSRVIVAHILPKRENGGFPSVADHPKNRVFLCPDCHTNFDNLGSDFAKTMPALDLMRERFKEFSGVLTVSEFTRVPDYLKNKK